jgi:hypothetical protein
MTMSVVTSVSTVGSKKLPPSADRSPPVTTLAPFLTASAIFASTFSTASMSIKGPITHPAPWLKLVGDFHRASSLYQPVGKFVVEAVPDYDEQTVTGTGSFVQIGTVGFDNSSGPPGGSAVHGCPFANRVMQYPGRMIDGPEPGANFVARRTRPEPGTRLGMSGSLKIARSF